VNCDAPSAAEAGQEGVDAHPAEVVGRRGFQVEVRVGFDAGDQRRIAIARLVGGRTSQRKAACSRAAVNPAVANATPQPSRRAGGESASSEQLRSINAQTAGKTGHHQGPEDEARHYERQPCTVCKIYIPGPNPGVSPIGRRPAQVPDRATDPVSEPVMLLAGQRSRDYRSWRSVRSETPSGARPLPLAWVHWFNMARLLEPIGHVPPDEH
jgi:hypothetical protein